MLKPGDVCVDIFGRLCLVIGAPVLMEQRYAVDAGGQAYCRRCESAMATSRNSVIHAPGCIVAQIMEARG